MVNSVVKTFKILEYIASQAEGQRLSEISKEFNLNPPTAHNLLKTLLEIGYIEKKENVYTLSEKFFESFIVPFKFNHLWKIAEPLMRQLSEQIRETVVLAVYHEGKRHVVGGHVSHQNAVVVPIPSDPDDNMYTKSTGRVLLSYLNEADLKKHVEINGFPRANWDSLDAWDQLMTATATPRKMGFAYIVDTSSGVTGFAVPLS